MALSNPPATRHQLFTSLPAELILLTIQHLPFGNGKNVSSLRHAHPRLGELVKIYEHSLTSSFIEKEMRHARVDFAFRGGLNLKWLASCVNKYDIVDDIMDALCSDRNCFRVERHNISLANAGMLLLYQLSSYR